MNIYSHIEEAKEAMTLLAKVKKFEAEYNQISDITQGMGIIIEEQKSGKAVYRISFGRKRDAGTWYRPRIIPVVRIGKLEDSKLSVQIRLFNAESRKKLQI